MDALTIYRCPIEGCPAFFGTDIDSEDGRGDFGWNPDCWPRCTEHNRQMRPVRIVPVTSQGLVPSEKEIKAAVDAVAREDERAHDREYVASVLERGGWEEHVARTALSAAEKEREGERACANCCGDGMIWKPEGNQMCPRCQGMGTAQRDPSTGRR